MKKKVKKIPKYSTGNAGVTAEYLSKVGGGAPTINTGGTTAGGGTTDGATGSGGGIGWGAIGAAATQIGKGMMHSFGVEDNSQLGVTLNNSMEWAELGGSIAPGWGHLIGGVAGATFGAFQKGGVDPNTGEIKYGGIFGRSKDSLMAESNMIKNNIRATQMTEQKKAEYAMNPNNPNGGAVMAAEGGIMRKPVDALVSKGELIYDPTTQKLRQVPGSKGKPNKADDVFARLYEGDVVISNSPTMLMANGKTPAQNLMGMVDKYATGGTVKAREAIIKKVVNWQEANKTKPQEYAMYNGGGWVTENGVKKHITKNSMGKPIYSQSGEPYLGDVKAITWNDNVANKGRYKVEYEKAALNDIATSFPGNTRSYGYYTFDGAFNDLSDVSPQNMPDSVRTGRTFYVPIGDFDHQESYAKLNAKADPTAGLNMKKIDVPRNMNHVKTPTQEEINAFYGYDREKVDETVKKDRNERINSKNRKYITDKDLYGGELDEVVVTAPKINKASSKNDAGKKSSSGKTTATTPQESKLTPEQIAESLRIEDIGERHWLRGPVTEPNQSLASLAQISPEQMKLQGVDKVAPLNGIKPLQQQDVDGEIAAPNGSDWRDGLYRMAVLSQPLWDRAKAEPVNYESPVYKYMPTQIDVSSQFRDADQSYALSRYNFANLYPNTGAGMAAGLQAASNRAKQYADIRQWQTNAQNELIGKNVGIYNNWANEHARILNDVYNKSAQNRAAARNINRQNRATALSNLGTMLSDDKKMAMDKLRLQTIEPMLQYGYQNYDNYLKWKKSNGYE